MSQETWRIIIIDDSAEDRAEVRRLLLLGSERRYRFTEASTGAAGIAAIGDEGPPECVILDRHLPDMDAASVLAALAGADGLPRCPVLVLTGDATREGSRAVLRAGAQDVLGKSWMTAESLVRGVENAAERWTLQRTLHEREQQLGMVFDAVGLMMFRWDIQADRVQRWRSRFAVLPTTGDDDAGPTTFEGVASVVHPADRAAFEAAVRAALAQGTSYTNTYRVAGLDGRDVWIEEHGLVCRDERGRAVTLLGASLDVTARRREAERRALLVRVARLVLETRVADADLSARLFEVIRGALQADVFFHYEIPREGGMRLVAAGGVSAAQRAAAARLEVGQTFCGHVAATRELIAADAARIAADPAGATVRSLGLRAYACHPLLSRDGRVLGTFSVGSRQRDAFDPGEVEFLQVVSHFLAQDWERWLWKQEQVEREARLRLALEATGTGLWTWDLNTDAVTWSPECYAIHAMALGSFGGTGAAFFQLVHPDDRARVEAAVRGAIAEQRFYESEFRILRPGQEPLWVENRGRASYDAAGQPLRVLGTITDISRRKTYEDALQTADRRKDEFLATLAHELRNPLAPIRNGLAVLRRAHGDKAMSTRIHDMMERQVGYLVHLVDDLLDMARISQGKINLRTDRLALAEVVHDAVEVCRPDLEAKRHTLALTLPARPLMVEGDQTRLVQVLTNLLNNAIKYTEPGGRIAASLAADGGAAVLEVTDTGVGIAPQLLPTIWDLFTQVRDTLDKAQGGLGIGLSLVRRLVELHGGTVSARSQGIGRGATFTIRLPLAMAPVEAAASPAPPRPAQADARAPRRVLVVDDNRDVAESLADLIQLEGHEIQVACDGRSAITAVQGFHPHLILLDIGLPGMSGYEVAARLRAEPAGRRAFLVAVTGWGQDEDRRLAQQAGFDLHLTKPVHFATLERLLAQLPAQLPEDRPGAARR